MSGLRTPAKISPRKIDATFASLRKEETQIANDRIRPFDGHDDTSVDDFVAGSILHEVDQLVAKGASRGEVRKVKQKFIMAVMEVRKNREHAASTQASFLGGGRPSAAEALERRLHTEEKKGRCSTFDEGNPRSIRDRLRWNRGRRQRALRTTLPCEDSFRSQMR